MARLLGPRHGEAHVGEEAARAPLADVALGVGVGLGRRGADRVEPELLREGFEFPCGHVDSLPRCARFGSTRTAGRGARARGGAGSEPAPGEVLVRLRASALNHLDVWIRKGLPSVPKPRILGADGAGVVEALGDRVTGFELGERVVLNPGSRPGGGRIHVIGEHGDGTNAELIAVPATNVHPIPDGLSFEEAAAFPLVFETAYRMLVTRAGLREGEWVLAWGIGGGVSTAALAIATALGARVLVTSSERREARARTRARRGRDR
jgi:threonine dehydrogenase-like Zn-dependent dehydrogenase